jgi:hypothetical protein
LSASSSRLQGLQFGTANQCGDSDGARTAVATWQVASENMVIASVNQKDIRIASLQGASRGDPSKASTDDHDSLRRRQGPPGIGELSLSRGYATSNILRGLTHLSSLGRRAD